MTDPSGTVDNMTLDEPYLHTLLQELVKLSEKKFGVIYGWEKITLDDLSSKELTPGEKAQRKKLQEQFTVQWNQICLSTQFSSTLQSLWEMGQTIKPQCWMCLRTMNLIHKRLPLNDADLYHLIADLPKLARLRQGDPPISPPHP